MARHDPIALFGSVSRQQIPPCDFHLHTTWTDGANSAAEMHQAAAAAGLKTILFSEHARRTSTEWFPRFADEVRALPHTQCRALVGVEVKVLDFSGALDTAPTILSCCDLVMASIHRFPGEAGDIHKTRNHRPEEALDIELRLTLAALDNPDVDILGHPFGMSYRRFKTMPPEGSLHAVIERAARTGVAVEVNARYHPDPWQLIDWCNGAGATVALGSNAHSLADVGRIGRILRGEEPAWTGPEW